MAINYQQLQSYRPNLNIGSALANMASNMPDPMDNIQSSLQSTIQKKLQPLIALYGTSLSEWGNQTVTPPNAFDAYNEWKSNLSKRELELAQKNGINALTFKQLFDGQQSLILDALGKKMKTYQLSTNADDSDMRGLLSGNSQLRGYLNANIVDPDVNNWLTPQKNWAQSLGGVVKAALPGYIATGEMDTGPEALSKIAGYAATGYAATKYGPGLVSKGKNFFGIKGAKEAVKGASDIVSKTTAKAGEQLTLDFGGKPTRNEILKRLSSKLGKSKALSILKKLPKNPYLILASLVGMGLYNLVKSKDTYQSSVAKNVAQTADLSNPTESFNKQMAAYKAKYGL
tara:strand:- start:6815 stop:7843 length:1029 start_codon:yes stop_codon:yes gene_type:complete